MNVDKYVTSSHSLSILPPEAWVLNVSMVDKMVWGIGNITACTIHDSPLSPGAQCPIMAGPPAGTAPLISLSLLS